MATASLLHDEVVALDDEAAAVDHGVAADDDEVAAEFWRLNTREIPPLFFRTVRPLLRICYEGFYDKPTTVCQPISQTVMATL